VKLILVATDRSPSADVAVRHAADMAARYEAGLLILQVLMPEAEGETATEEAARVTQASDDLALFAREMAGDRGRHRVVVDRDPAAAIVDVARTEGVDAIVVGNVGMAGRKRFLLGNVPNRVSHNAPCSVFIVNTSDPAAPAPEPVITQKEPEVEGHLLGRAARIGRVAAKHDLRDLFKPLGPGDDIRERARRLRTAFEELGPTFGKLGQILSTRPDLLPPEYIEELSTLQNEVPPLTEAEVVEVMEQELGVPWEDVFESLDPEPLAAGTIAQVHTATLADGEDVVVKVQRPTARTDIMQDLGLLEMFAAKTAHRPAFRQLVDLEAIVEHLSTSLQEELDFRQEAANADRLRKVLEPYPRLDVPQVHTDFSTDRLLVLERIKGVRISEAPDSPDRRDAARQLLESYYRQILTDGFFHADPHPGNLLWHEGTIWFLDTGMTGEVGPEIREYLLLLLMAFWQHDVSFLSDVVLMLTGEDQRPDLDVHAFEQDLGRVVDRYRDSSLKEIQLGPILQEITEISVKHDVPLPASLALTGKALAQMQLVVAQMDPDLDPFTVAGGFVMKGLTGRLRERADPRRLFYEAQKLKTRAVRLIEAFERLTGARPGPKLQVHFRGMENLETTVRRAARRLAVAMAAGSAIVASAITVTSTDVAGWIPAVLGAAGGVLTVGLVFDLLRARR
jgi:predicted unusual protein kinase regulating ubiquinone biosynthesis (AarF/ABC1/UbiB family)/nucleotide-binding universal stress UspA family protein